MEHCSMNILHEQISAWKLVKEFHSIKELWIFLIANWPSKSHAIFSVHWLDNFPSINYFCFCPTLTYFLEYRILTTGLKFSFRGHSNNTSLALVIVKSQRTQEEWSGFRIHENACKVNTHNCEKHRKVFHEAHSPIATITLCENRDVAALHEILTGFTLFSQFQIYPHHIPNHHHI